MTLMQKPQHLSADIFGMRSFQPKSTIAHQKKICPYPKSCILKSHVCEEYQYLFYIHTETRVPLYSVCLKKQRKMESQVVRRRMNMISSHLASHDDISTHLFPMVLSFFYISLCFVQKIISSIFSSQFSPIYAYTVLSLQRCVIC